MASSVFLAAMLASAAHGLHPYLLPGLPGAAPGLTVHNAAAAQASLHVALYWWLPGMALAVTYTVMVYRRLIYSAPGTAMSG